MKRSACGDRPGPLDRPRATRIGSNGHIHSPSSPYFVFDARLRDFEEDHRVPLGLGGAPRNHRNLWPEPRHGQWNAESKDQLEDVIHDLVCRHEMPLEQGQAVFLADWREGYRKYVERR
jgi:hypothetical protein